VRRPHYRHNAGFFAFVFTASSLPSAPPCVTFLFVKFMLLLLLKHLPRDAVALKSQQLISFVSYGMHRSLYNWVIG
jgi:hypothetical protein